MLRFSRTKGHQTSDLAFYTDLDSPAEKLGRGSCQHRTSSKAKDEETCPERHDLGREVERSSCHVHGGAEHGARKGHDQSQRSMEHSIQAFRRCRDALCAQWIVWTTEHDEIW